MRAMAINQYGEPDEVREQDLPEPKVGPDTVLVRVRGAGVNPVDYKVVAGGLDPAFPAHFPLIPGWDVSGVVERVGPAVRGIAAGDEVIAYNRQHHIQWGTFAELAAVPAPFVAPRPHSLDLATAGALPLAGLTAYQALTEGLEVRAGDVVVVLAASGGVGHLAVQIAAALGARPVGVASGDNAELVRGLGAVEFVDYTAGDVAAQLRERFPDGVDAVLDLHGGEALTAAPGLLREGGRLASIVDAATVLEQGGRYVFVRPDGAQLQHLGGMVDDGRLRVEVQQRFALEKAAEALRAQQSGHARGKLLLEV